MIVVYATNMDDQINAAIKADDKYVSDEMTIDQAALGKGLKADGV